MMFDLWNDMVTFCALINKVFTHLFDMLLVMYLDDSVIFSESMEHKEHLCIGFQDTSGKSTILEEV